jgi:hypothetical protein
MKRVCFDSLTKRVHILQFKVNVFQLALDGGVAQWASHPPQEQKTRVRVPPGCKVFRGNIAMLLSIFDLICNVRVLKKEK